MPLYTPSRSDYIVNTVTGNIRGNGTDGEVPGAGNVLLGTDAETGANSENNVLIQAVKNATAGGDENNGRNIAIGAHGYPAFVGNYSRRSVVIGPDAAISDGSSEVDFSDSVVIGADAVSESGSGVALGSGALVSNGAQLALGASAEATHGGSIAIGSGAVTTAEDQIVIGAAGQTVSIPGTFSITGLNPITPSGGAEMGDGASATGINALALGPGAVASEENSIAVGYTASVSAESGIAIGRGAAIDAAAGNNSIAIGALAEIYALNSIAVGQSAYIEAGSYGSTALGDGAEIYSPDSVALGASAVVDELSDNSIAIGSGAYAAHELSAAVGAFATTTADNQIMLGTDARTVALPGAVAVGSTNTATVGPVTIDRAAGRVNIAASAASLVVTNSLVNTDSHVLAVISQNDATAQIKNIVPDAGSFTINLASAATADTSVDFFVINFL